MAGDDKGRSYQAAPSGLHGGTSTTGPRAKILAVTVWVSPEHVEWLPYLFRDGVQLMCGGSLPAMLVNFPLLCPAPISCPPDPLGLLGLLNSLCHTRSHP